MGAPADELLVRRASAADVAQLVELRWLSSVEERTPAIARTDFEAHCADFLRDVLVSGSWAIWVAEVDGRIDATVYVEQVDRVPRPWPTRPWGYVTAVYTREEARSRGVGTRLIEQVIDWSRRGALHLLLVWPSERSISFYRRAGFVPSVEAHELHITED